MPYSYQREKLYVARSHLMLPHPQGVESSITHALHECDLAFMDMDEEAPGEERVPLAVGCSGNSKIALRTADKDDLRGWWW